MRAQLMRAEEACRLLRSAARPMPLEACPAERATGRVLGRAVSALGDVPPFANAAMDGYALSGPREVRAGTELTLIGELPAGTAATRAVAPGEAVAIMTGAPLPPAADRVVPVEHALLLDGGARLRVARDTACGANVRPAGSDMHAGQVLLAAGTLVDAHSQMLLVATGVRAVAVVRRPRVALVVTGRELVDDPAAGLLPGQIRNVNGPLLAARLRQAGAALIHHETVPADTPEAIAAACRRGLDAGADLLLSSGAVSVGRYDCVPEVLARLGAQTLFRGVAMRPGKPLLAARLPAGAICVGLPGNPVAAAVGLRFFVEPLLREMLRLPAEQPWQVPMLAPWRQRRRLQCYSKARVVLGPAGQLGVRILPGQESYRLLPLAAANAWVVTPPATEALEPGAEVAVYGLGHLQGPQLATRAVVDQVPPQTSRRLEVV